MAKPGISFTVNLTALERDVLVEGLSQHHGPWDPSKELARLMGFKNPRDLRVQADRISAAIEQQVPMSRQDWARAMCCVETVALTSRFGVRFDWQTATGIDLTDTVTAMESIEAKVHAAYREVSPREG